MDGYIYIYILSPSSPLKLLKFSILQPLGSIKTRNSSPPPCLLPVRTTWGIQDGHCVWGIHVPAGNLTWLWYWWPFYTWQKWYHLTARLVVGHYWGTTRPTKWKIYITIPHVCYPFWLLLIRWLTFKPSHNTKLFTNLKCLKPFILTGFNEFDAYSIPKKVYLNMSEIWNNIPVVSSCVLWLCMCACSAALPESSKKTSPGLNFRRFGARIRCLLCSHLMMMFHDVFHLPPNPHQPHQNPAPWPTINTGLRAQVWLWEWR